MINAMKIPNSNNQIPNKYKPFKKLKKLEFRVSLLSGALIWKEFHDEASPL